MNDSTIDTNALIAENNRLSELLMKFSAVTPPVLPNLELPAIPVVPHADAPYQPNGEGGSDIITNPVSTVPPPPEGKDRILIVIPTVSISYEFFESFLKFWTSICMASNQGKLPFEVGYHIVYRTPVHIAENKLVKVAQHNKATHVLFMDDDIFDTTVEDIMNLWLAQKDVISGIMHASKFPHAMCAFRRFYPDTKKVIDMPSDNTLYRLYEIPCNCNKCGMGLSHWDIKHCPGCGEPQNQIIQRVDLVPLPFTLIKMTVFDRIKTPWFHCTDLYPTDSWFCDRCMEAGIEVFAHMGVRLNHAGINDFTKPHFVNIGMEKAKKGGSIIGLTPTEMEAHQYLLSTKMKETEDRLRTRPFFVNAAYEGNTIENGMTIVSTPHKSIL